MALCAWAIAACGTGERCRVLGELGLECVRDEPGEHLSLGHAVAFVGEHLDDAQAFDLRADEDLLARDERAGDQQRSR